jgi:uncharacterized protein (DUF433 family)
MIRAYGSLVPTAEAAFIAGLNDRQMNRLVDEHLVPGSLLGQDGTTRLFARLSAAFARFYFDTDQLLVANARRQVFEELTSRVEQLPFKADVLALVAMPSDVNWKVARAGVEIDMLPFVTRAFVRAKEVDDADALVSCDPDIMAGAACFTGTRVPIDVVLASVENEIDPARLRESYSFLTDAHVAAAQVYAQIHPRRGRPRRLADSNLKMLRRITRVVRPAKE